jgi:hypothetical protein
MLAFRCGYARIYAEKAIQICFWDWVLKGVDNPGVRVFLKTNYFLIARFFARVQDGKTSRAVLWL